jgi:uncharacterized protein YjdB
LSYCDGKNLVNAITISVVSIRLNVTSASLAIGDSLQLNVDTAGLEGESITWSSNNIDAVEVDATGKVTAVGKGVAIITVKVGEQWVTCEVKSCEKYEIATVEQLWQCPRATSLSTVY